MRQLVFLFLISLTACNGQTKKSDQTIDKQTEASNFEVPDSTYVILDYKSDWHWLFKDVEPATLTENELVEVESIIEKAVKENNEQQQESLEKHNKEYPNNQWTETGFELRTKGFKRQYVPVINRDGQKEIWINFFCDDWGNDNWKSGLMIVEDGGNCYFNLKVNLETGTYSELYINGYS
ncbi:MAG TPA: hypothetical protein PKA00_20045 [Saprospiraceae bacterium]|nr:hypothetical protein [Saprospiraceae bacterium]HMQ85213.1 hypothetical protein [Saprospiraceae bacterium]